MTNQQIYIVLIMLGFIIFLGSMLMNRSYSDSFTIHEYAIENGRLHDKNDEYLSELNYTRRLNDLISGRLFELVRFTSGNVDGSLDAFQKLVDRIESDLSEIDMERKK